MKIMQTDSKATGGAARMSQGWKLNIRKQNEISAIDLRYFALPKISRIVSF